MANKLREFRFFKGLSQWQVRMSTGISQSKLSLIERGFIQPDDNDKAKIAKAFHVKAEEIFPRGETQ